MTEPSVFDLANIAIAGFAAVSAVLLLLAYAVLIDVPGKSIYSVASCAALAGRAGDDSGRAPRVLHRRERLAADAGRPLVERARAQVKKKPTRLRS